MEIIGILLVCLLASVALFCWLRCRAYRRFVPYNRRLDYAYQFSRSQAVKLSVRCGRDHVSIPERDQCFDTAFLALEVQANLPGHLVDPYLEMEEGETIVRQYIERGGAGLRYFNLSQMLPAAGKAEVRIKLRGFHLRWAEQDASVFLFSNAPTQGEKVLVVAPHPDDAEIAAFGLYSVLDSVIVTLSSGHASNYDYRPLVADTREHPALTARLRTWDSLMVGALGGVSPAKAVNLCVWDGRLAEMHAEPSRDFTNEGPRGVDYQSLRAQNISPFLPPGPGQCSWHALVADLVHVLKSVKPTLIVLPYPDFDNHPDHDYSTVAVCEAIQQAGLSHGRLFFYINHNRHTELHPFGPAGSVASLGPIFDHRLPTQSIYSLPLPIAKQREKFFALEAMHDLREMPVLGTLTWKQMLRRCRTQLHAKLHGMGKLPPSHIRRGVRANEIFFVRPVADSQAIVQDFFVRREEMRRQSNPAGRKQLIRK